MDDNKSFQRIETFINGKRQIFDHQLSIFPQAIQNIDFESPMSIDENLGSKGGISQLSRISKSFKVDSNENDIIINTTQKQQMQVYLQQIPENPLQIQQLDPILQEQIYQDQKFSPKNSQKGFQASIWRHGALRIVYYISKFVQSLFETSETTKFRLITPKIFSLLNDRASDFNFYQILGLIKGSISCWGRASLKVSGFCFKYFPVSKINKFSVVQPDGYLKILWDLFFLNIIVLNMFYVPMKLAFEFQKQDFRSLSIFLDDLPNWAFLFEIILSFNTAYYDQGKINSGRRSIIYNYLKGDFLIDSIIFVAAILTSFQVPFAEFFLLLRVTKMKKLFTNVEEVLNLRERFAAIVDLLKLVYLVIFVGHFCACAWYYLATFEGPSSWLYYYELQDATNTSKYINALYWSVITLLTVGYGDMLPVTDTEKCFVIMMSLVTCGVFGYAINSIGAIFKEMEEKTERIRNQMALINSHMRRNNLSKQLQLKVRKYFEYFFQRQEESDEKVRLLLEDLTPDLKNEVMIDMYKMTLLSSKLLRENLSDECIKQLCLAVKEKKLSPDEIIFEKNKSIDKLYFVQSGKIKIYYQQKDPKKALETSTVRIRHFQSGYVLGEKNFLQQTYMDYMAQSAGFSSIVYIEYQDFIESVRLFPQDYEKICLLKDKLFFNPIFKKVFTVCEICSGGHSFKNCPFPFYQVNRTKLIMIENQSKPQNRQLHKRNKKKFKIDRQLLLHAGLAISLNEKILNEEDLDDDYVIKLGFQEEDTRNESEMFSQFDDDGYQQLQSIRIQFDNSDNQSSKNIQSSRSEIDDQFQPIPNITIPSSENLQLKLTNANGKKGILKKTSFVAPSLDVMPKNSKKERSQIAQQDLNFDLDKVENDSNEENSDNKITKQISTIKIKRKQQRSNQLSFRYDRANSFLSKLRKMENEQKSILGESSFVGNPKKTQELLRQITSQTVKDDPQQQNQSQEGQQKIISHIKEDILHELDKQKNFIIYFPSFNLKNVLSNILKFQKRKNDNRIRQSLNKTSIAKTDLLKKKLQGISYLANRQ